MSLNNLKTEFIVIAFNAMLEEGEETLHIYVQGEVLHRAPYVESSGFYVDHQLDWEDPCERRSFCLFIGR